MTRFFGAVVLVGLAIVLVSRPSPVMAQGQPVPLPPNVFDSAKAWINTADRIRLPDLRGKIVLLDFWTFCCINCHHVIKELEYLEARYPNQLVVIGVHSPKFDAEKLTENVRRKVDEYRIKHPVINDADQTLWKRFNVTTWPTLVLIDAKGNMVDRAEGEGNREGVEMAIKKLIEQHRSLGELNETPLVFRPESDKPRNTPLNFPGKILADAKGNRLFISDTGYDRIVVTDLDGKFQYSIGSGESGYKDGTFTDAAFQRQQGMCLIDEILYIADVENHAIRAADLKAKTVITVAGNGQQTYHKNETEGPARTFGLNSPWDLVQVPDEQSLIIAMAGPHQLWKLDLDGKKIAIWSGSGIEGIGDGDPKIAKFAQPSGLVTDGKMVFVADSEISGIRQVELKTGKVATLIGHGLFDFADKDGRFGTARLQHCLGVVYADGKLYIADSYNNKVKVADLAKKRVETLAGAGSAGFANGTKKAQFYQPGGLSLAGETLYVADTNNSLIRTIDLNTKEVKTLTLEGVQPPAAKRKAPKFLLAEKISQPAVKVKPAKTIKVHVEVKLPKNFELNADTPMPYLVEATDNAQLIQTDPYGSLVQPPATKFVAEVALTKLPADGAKLNLKLSIGTFVCQKGNKGQCSPKSYVVGIPIEFSETGDSEIRLTVGSDAKPASRPRSK